MRLRVVQPALWDSELVAELSWDARLVLVGMWSYVRDEGVGKDQLGLIIGQLFAFDAEKDNEGTRQRVAAALDELCASGLLIRFEHGGLKYIEVADWPDWQKPDHPAKRRFPTFAEHLATVSREPLDGHATVSRSELETDTELETELATRGAR